MTTNDVRKTDRRSTRSQQLLHRALLELMLEKRYDKITVQDIIDRANVGRSTFYAHYQDKEDLLVSNFERMLETHSDHWLTDEARIGEAESPAENHISVVGLFQHVQEHHALYQALVWGRGMELLHGQAQRYLTKRVEARLQTVAGIARQTDLPLSLLATHIAATLGTLLRWWLEADMPQTPEQMDAYFHQLIVPTLKQALRSKESESVTE